MAEQTFPCQRAGRHRTQREFAAAGRGGRAAAGGLAGAGVPAAEVLCRRRGAVSPPPARAKNVQAVRASSTPCAFRALRAQNVQTELARGTTCAFLCRRAGARGLPGVWRGEKRASRAGELESTHLSCCESTERASRAEPRNDLHLLPAGGARGLPGVWRGEKRASRAGELESTHLSCSESTERANRAEPRNDLH